MNKFDTVCNQILSEEYLIEDLIQSLGDQSLAIELHRFNTKELPTCVASGGSTQTCSEKLKTRAQQILNQIIQRVKNPNVTQLIQQYKDAHPVSILRALYTRLFSR